MPRFFFDFRGCGADAADDLGVEFDSLELAYVDAYRGMVRMCADMLLEQENPRGLVLDIRNEARVVLMTLCYDEVFCQAPSKPATEVQASVRWRIGESRRLRADLQEACAQARTSLESARATIRLAQVLTASSRQGS